MNERNAIQTILNHLQEQHQQYVQLLELAEQQKQAIDDNANERLLEIVNAKNPLVQRSHQLEQEIVDLAQTLTQEEQQELVKQGETLKGEVLKTLDSLIQLEEVCSKELEARKNENQQQLQDFKDRKKGLKGYGSF